MLAVLGLNLGLMYFDTPSIKPSKGGLIASSIAVAVFTLLSLLLAISLSRQPQNQAKITFKVSEHTRMDIIVILGTGSVFFAVPNEHNLMCCFTRVLFSFLEAMICAHKCRCIGVLCTCVIAGLLYGKINNHR